MQRRQLGSGAGSVQTPDSKTGAVARSRALSASARNVLLTAVVCSVLYRRDLRTDTSGLSLRDAEAWCGSNSSCGGFTFELNGTKGVLSCDRWEGLKLSQVYFKQGQETNTDKSWRTYNKANFTPPFDPSPAYRGCDGPPGSLLPWCAAHPSARPASRCVADRCVADRSSEKPWCCRCDHSKSHSDRLDLLLASLTLTEKIGLLSPTKALGNPCNTHTIGAPRVGLSDYMWLEESNTGVSSSCLGPGHCATTFAGAAAAARSVARGRMGGRRAR